MADPYHFPPEPGKFRSDPFRDPAGNNPFADPQQAEPASENPYSAQVVDSARPAVGGYETLYPHHGPAWLTLGLISLLAAMVLAYVLRPFAVIFLGVTVPLWVMAARDWSAIRLGAMDPAGKGMTVIGAALAALASLVSIGPAAALLFRSLLP